MYINILLTETDTLVGYFSDIHRDSGIRTWYNNYDCFNNPPQQCYYNSYNSYWRGGSYFLTRGVRKKGGSREPPEPPGYGPEYRVIL